MRAIVIAAVFMLAAGPAAAQHYDKTLTDWGRFTFRPDDGRTGGMVAGSPDSVFAVIRTYLAEAGIKAKAAAGRFQLDAERERIVRRLGREPISNFLSCGSGLTGPNADTWHVYYSLSAAVGPGNGGTQLAMAFSAEAIDVPNGRNERISCTTTGRLEYRLVQRLRQIFPGTQ